MIDIFFDKKTSGGAVKNENMLNQELAEELDKPFIREFENREVYSSFIDNIWGADLSHMKLLSKFDKDISFLLCLIDIYSKHLCYSF